MAQEFNELTRLSKPAKLLGSVSHLLSWDQETKMPKKAAPFRAEQMEYLAKLIHLEKQNPKFEEALFKLIDRESGEILVDHLEERQQKALEEWRRDQLIASKLPASFVSKCAHSEALAQDAWAKAKQNNDFATFAPHLETMLEQARKRAEYLGYTDHIYDALLDLHEPEMTVAELNPIFAALRPRLIELTKKASKPIDDSFLYGNFPLDLQEQFTTPLLQDMGICKNVSRIDHSNHPFCQEIHPTDVRLTTHLDSSSIMGNISAVMHEGGHALYELGLPKRFYGTPLCEAVSYGMHESQSRFYETIIGQSLAFWRHYYPKLQTLFPKQLGNVSLEKFYDAINIVRPSLIRVQSDEVTYSLHVILRYELELDLLTGKLKVNDLPDAWNAKTNELLGITPKTNAEGCLQDIHWSGGAFGYFPTYALGNIIAAQIFASFRGDFPDWEERLAQGHLTFVKEWLNESVHRYGRQYTPKKLVARITNKPLGHEDYLQYLETKYR